MTSTLGCLLYVALGLNEVKSIIKLYEGDSRAFHVFVTLSVTIWVLAKV